MVLGELGDSGLTAREVSVVQRVRVPLQDVDLASVLSTKDSVGLRETPFEKAENGQPRRPPGIRSGKNLTNRTPALGISTLSMTSGALAVQVVCASGDQQRVHRAKKRT